ncbi:sensor histidine kinase [Prauserella cavernicola]|uniref:histidine kinase n=1 Tax=Prauserella cavernicola TaxID=2800127 RepID=A0A934QWE2_9PSEU|nr:histidine kinase [Prauserella cavernicola]MBK1787845.1 sensor histidine kinase [Prauserella cavernicola]
MEQRSPRARRRDARAWVVDTALFLFAVADGVFTAVTRIESVAAVDPALFVADQVVAVLGCLALWLRRRWPVGVALVLVAASTFSELVAGALFVAVFTVAVRCLFRTTCVVFGLGLLAAVTYGLLRPEPGLSMAVMVMLIAGAMGTAVGWGLFVQRRRNLIERARTEEQLRAQHAQLEAREAVAREMHDVLGHRLTLLSLHAGALEYRRDASPDEVASAAAVIRQSAHQAMQDLREVIGVLRTPVEELPQPTFDDITGLVAETSAAGLPVRLDSDVEASVPDKVGRTAYRVVQEALTNARKHAHLARTTVRLSGDAIEGLTVEVVNAASTAEAQTATSAGYGLVGLTERIALANGRLEYGPDSGGGWRIWAWLPWKP